METKTKNKIIGLAGIFLILVCCVQGWIIYRNWNHHSPDSDIFQNEDRFSTFLDKQFQNDKNQKWSLFDRYFNDDFFSNRSDPFDEMARMQQQLDELMSEHSGKMFNDTWDGWFDDRFFGGSSEINIDTTEKKDAYLITINIPNLKENKINIHIEKDAISINGDFSQTIEKRDNDGNIINKHEMFKSISRTLPVPDGVDTDKAVIDQNGDNIIIRLPKKVS